jgi:hypothetical protein
VPQVGLSIEECWPGSTEKVSTFEKAQQPAVNVLYIARLAIAILELQSEGFGHAQTCTNQQYLHVFYY